MNFAPKGKIISPFKRHIDTAIAQSTTKEELQRNLYAAGAIISDGADLLDIPADGEDDPEETTLINRMQKQHNMKKRGRGI